MIIDIDINNYNDIQEIYKYYVKINLPVLNNKNFCFIHDIYSIAIKFIKIQFFINDVLIDEKINYSDFHYIYNERNNIKSTNIRKIYEPSFGLRGDIELDFPYITEMHKLKIIKDYQTKIKIEIKLEDLEKLILYKDKITKKYQINNPDLISFVSNPENKIDIEILKY